MDFFEQQEPGFFQKYRAIILCGVLAVAGTLIWFFAKALNQKTRPREERSMMMVSLPPPPPSTPPPAQQMTKPVEQKMMTQEPVDAMEYRPQDNTPTETTADTGPAIGTSITGDGPGDSFGLRANSRVGGGTGPVTRRQGSRFGWYAAQVQNTISKALQENNTTRFADFRVETRVWADHTGRITRAKLAGSTGNAALDGAITNQVLQGLILKEAPPEGMPMPIVLRLTARPSKTALAK